MTKEFNIITWGNTDHDVCGFTNVMMFLYPFKREALELTKGKHADVKRFIMDKIHNDYTPKYKFKISYSDEEGEHWSYVTTEEFVTSNIDLIADLYIEFLQAKNFRERGIDAVKKLVDNVNHPSHYAWTIDKCGIEPIDIARHMNFNLGSALKYIVRSGHKKDASMSDREKQVEDLKKALWYIEDEIERLLTE